MAAAVFGFSVRFQRLSARFFRLVNIKNAPLRYSTRIQSVHRQKVTRVAGVFVDWTQKWDAALANICEWVLLQAASATLLKGRITRFSSTIMEYEDKNIYIYLEEDAVACSVFILATPLLCVKKLARQMWTFKGTPLSSGSAADPAAGFSCIQLLLEIT